METIKIDVLVIGSVHAKEYVTWMDYGSMMAIGNALVDKNEIPSRFPLNGKIYDTSEAIVIRAQNQGVIDIESLRVPHGKKILFTQHVTSLGQF